MPKIFLLMPFLFINLLLSANASESTADKIRAINKPSTTAEQLKKYVNDSNREVRKALASRATTPANLLIQLSKDPEYRVRAAVAHNLRAPKQALLPLVNDESSDVRLALAHCGYTPPDILEKLINDPSEVVRKQLILNPNLSMRVLRSIAEGQSDIADAAGQLLKQREEQVEQQQEPEALK